MQRTLLLSWILFFTAVSIYGETVFQDGFNRNGNLIGSVPEKRSGAERWAGYAIDSWRSSSGSIAVKDCSGNRNAWLGFTPESGKIYKYSVEYDIASGSFGIGFATNLTGVGGLGLFQFDAASMRVNSSGKLEIGMDNGSVGSLVAPDGIKAATKGTMAMILNTTGTPWSVEWQLNGNTIRTGTFTTKPSILGIVIGASSGTSKVTALTLLSVE